MKAALADMDAVGSQALADLPEGEIRLFGHQPQKPALVRQELGRRMTTHRLRLDAAGLALALHPCDRRRGTDLKVTGCGPRRAASFDSVNQAFAKLQRVSSRHDSSQFRLLGQNHIQPPRNIMK
jgi:hypothetical protein